jgi:hypothetical protein
MKQAMSKLRQNIVTAKRAYRSHRYEGNLAADLLPAGPRFAWRWIGAAVATAALVALIVWVAPAGRQHRNVVQIDLPDATVQDHELPGNSADEGAEPVALAIEAIPSMPEFGPLWAAAEQQFEPSENWVPSFPAIEQLAEVMAYHEEDPS